MPKRRISSGAAPLQLDCSDGAKMLIEQMKLHPEEFKGYAGKFTNLLDTAREASQGLHRNVKMSQRDSAAILDAAEEHLYEVWLAADVLTLMMAPKPEPEKAVWYTAQNKSVVSQMSGPNISNSVYSNDTIGSSNTSTAQYIEQAYRLEQEKYKMELEKLRHQENEYALRNTKPFTGFL